MYELLVHDQITVFEERGEAVKAAKELTARPDMHVTANVTNGVETLSYRDGKLVAYTYETRRNERRGGPGRDHLRDHDDDDDSDLDADD